VRAFARWARLRNEHWIEGWVMTTAMNLCRRSFRHRVWTRQPRSHSTTVAAPTALAVDVASAMRRLPPRQRVAVVLHYLTDMPVPDVARAMDVSEGTVKAHLAQARQRLRPMLEVSDGG
jgi:RNA polymerase sigma-70 factor (ECF subfamily)